VAVALAVGYHFAHPAGELIQLPFIAAVMILWFCLLFVLRIVPKHHWEPLRHILRSALHRGSALNFNKRAGLRSLDGSGRTELKAAVMERMPDQTLVPAYVDDETEGHTDAPPWMVHPDTEGARLVQLLRKAGKEGGIPIEDESEVDAGIALFLFSDQPVAVRLRRMRQLLAAGVDAHDLRTLEDLRNDLAKAGHSVWDLASKNGKNGAKKGKQGGAKEKLGAPKRA